MKLEDLTPNASLRGILADATVTVESVQWHGSDALTLVYRGPSGRVAEEILYRSDEPLETVEQGRPWSFDGDGALFRLVSEYSPLPRRSLGKGGLTILQRRLASPEAIYQSLRRRRERLEKRLGEVKLLARGAAASISLAIGGPSLDAEYVEDLDDAPEYTSRPRSRRSWTRRPRRAASTSSRSKLTRSQPRSDAGATPIRIADLQNPARQGAKAVETAGIMKEDDTP